MRPTSGDVDAFLAAIPGETRRADARTLCTLLADVTGEPAALWASGIIGFGTYRYRYESGHEGTAPLAGFAARKAHLVIYLIGGFEDRHHTVMAKLGSFKTGKGCLYLKRLADVDVDVLRDLVDRSVRVRRGVDRAAGTDQAP
ncbi:MAG: DUF1801 domain-containing protein [Jiangellaceae bacterium]